MTRKARVALDPLAALWHLGLRGLARELGSRLDHALLAVRALRGALRATVLGVSREHFDKGGLRLRHEFCCCFYPTQKKSCFITSI